MTRWKAAGIHLSVSVLVIGTLAALAWHFWFPHALYRVAALDRMLFTMAGIDVVVGPLLTLLVYRRGKPSLRFDLTVIALLQAAFLGYALHSAWASRPVYLVWSVDRFRLVFANELEPARLREAPVPWARELPWFGPRLVGVQLGNDAAQREHALQQILQSGTSVDHLPRFYRPYAQTRDAVMRWSAPLPARLDARMAAAVRASDRPATALRWTILESSRARGWLLVDARSLQPVLAVARDPGEEAP